MIECNGYLFTDIFGIAAIGPITEHRGEYSFTVQVRSVVIPMKFSTSRGTSAVFRKKDAENARIKLIADIQNYHVEMHL